MILNMGGTHRFTVAHAYLRSSCISIHLRALLVPSDRKNPTADLMDVAVAQHIVPK